VNFTNVPSSSNLRFSRFPTNYSTLPSVSFVVPNLCNDMYDCSISTGDTWLKNNINGYAQWAKANNSLLILTFDEDDGSQQNQIATVFYGQHVKVGSYSEHITHYNVLRTIEDAYGLPLRGEQLHRHPDHRRLAVNAGRGSSRPWYHRGSGRLPDCAPRPSR
jgi:phosphatidylinositol-3-phosphatase